jgi:hypothetical protein
MYDYHFFVSGLGVIIGFVGYYPYFRDIFRGTTKPHVFTWFIWGLINAIACAAQIVSGGGWGALVTGFVSFLCLSIAALALFRGEKRITVTDWICFITALFGIALWIGTKDPLIAVVIVTIADTLAVIPTIRKAFHKPDEETAASYAIAVLRSLCGIIALNQFTLVNWLYPVATLISDATLTAMLLIRRHQLRQQTL